MSNETSPGKTKTDEGPALPPKTDVVVWLELTPEQREVEYSTDIIVHAHYTILTIIDYTKYMHA